jgi:glycosyltransferase domain-containing protein
MDKSDLSNSDLSKFTIVVISLNRQRFLQRQIDFWSETNAKLLIIDGSSEPAVLRISENSASRIRYIHSPKSLSSRFLYSTDLVDTEYAALLPDDEFFVPSAVRSFLDEMESNRSVDAVIGRTIRFTHKGGKLLAAKQYSSFRNPTGEQTRGIEGTKSFWDDDSYVLNYPIYSIMRSDVYKSILKKVFSSEYSNAYAYEIKFHLVFPFFYQSKIVETLYWMRSNENDPISISNFDRTKRFSTWYLSPLNSNDSEIFLDDVVAALEVNDGEVNRIREEVRKILLKYCERDVEKSLISNNRRIDGISRLTRKIAPPRIRTLLLGLMPHIFLRRIGYELQELKGLCGEISAQGISVDVAQLKVISELILNFHKSN